MTCPYEKYFIDYVSGDLEEKEKLSFQMHLDSCPTCAQLIEEFYSLHNKIKHRKRKTPDSELLTKYHKSFHWNFQLYLRIKN